jgi:hypothetical protein
LSFLKGKGTLQHAKRRRDFTSKEQCWPPQGKETLLYADKGLYPLGMQSLILKFWQKGILEGALTFDYTAIRAQLKEFSRHFADNSQTCSRLKQLSEVMWTNLFSSVVDPDMDPY